MSAINTPQTLSALCRTRRGISVIQLLTLLTALGAGVWLGAYYVGVGVEDLAYTALDESNVLATIPEDWRPELPPSLDPDPEKRRLAAEMLDQELSRELKDLHSEVGQLQQDQPRTTSGEAAASRPGRTQTLAYWVKLQEIADAVRHVDQQAEAVATEENATYVLELRERAYRYGMRAIAAVDTQGVDSQAQELGHSFQLWCERGAEIYRQALNLWQNEPLRSTFATDRSAWEASRRQYESQTELFREKIKQVRSTLHRRYGDGFGEFDI